MKLLISCLLALVVFARAEAPKFELRDGDRVLLLGDALLERENTLGFLEARMHAAFPDVKFTVRNLSWAGDTPKGWSRASFDAPAKGYERLKEQIALVKPTVVFLGYGMAASLQELTDTSGDIMLNRDPARYGEEPMSAARFKKELGELMTDIEAIAAASTAENTKSTKTGEESSAPSVVKTKPRFVLLSPIPHEDLRRTRPGMVDPAKHNNLLLGYMKAVGELANERKALHIDLFTHLRSDNVHIQSQTTQWVMKFTHNGIHLDPKGHDAFADFVCGNLKEIPKSEQTEPSDSLTAAILRKNDLFFHRTRPANSTYLFGFRKQEQGRNAVEIPQFDPLVDAVDAEIDALKRQAKKGASAAPGGSPKMPRTSFPADSGSPKSPSTTSSAVSGSPKDPGTTFPAVSGSPKEPSTTSSAVSGSPKEPSTTFSAISGSPKQPSNTSSAISGSQKTPPTTSNPPQPLPLPIFSVQEGYEISLWADTNLVGKPVGMNWDAAGRLWVACSPVYPQIAPGDHPEDKVVVIEDTDRDGKADKSTTFATNLLIAAGVAPDLAEGQRDKRDKKDSTPSVPLVPLVPSPNAAYVGSSTELVHVTDTDGDGTADQRRVVLSGFGTEDTHHTIHTLKWGPDGRLYFNQSIYIHSHLETPYGMVRLNSGGIFAYDPRTERTEVIAKGWCNPWGHVWDEWGQQFVTDGAGSQGISWLVPGAMYFTYENGRKIMPSITPGGNPKFCGLELVRSPLFPADWQGHALTCDFRAHRIVRFEISDLSEPPRDQRDQRDLRDKSLPSPASLPSLKSGYEARPMPDLVRSTDASFRPIDIKHGPDGALYVADWTNPVINHGEVDFRDPRRDKVNGRIWRIAPKGSTPIKWESLVGKNGEELKKELFSKNAWSLSQARQINQEARVLKPNAEDERESLEYAFASGNRGAYSLLAKSKSHQMRAMAARNLGNFSELIAEVRKICEDFGKSAQERDDRRKAAEKELEALLPQIVAEKKKNRTVEKLQKRETELKAEIKRLQPAWCNSGIPTFEEFQADAKKPALDFTRDPNPRVRLEAMRALSRFQSKDSAEFVLEAAVNVPKDDPHYAYAAWLSVNDLAPQVIEWLETEPKAAPNPNLSFVTPKPATKPADRDAMISFAAQSLPAAKTGPLLSKVIAKNGVSKDGPWIELIGQVGGAAECEKLVPLMQEPRAVAALVAAARRGVKPAAATISPAAIINGSGDVLRLAGLWKLDRIDAIAAVITPGQKADRLDAAFEALATLRTPAAATVLETLLAAGEFRSRALTALAAFKPDAALAALSSVAKEGDEAAQLALFRALFQSEQFKAKFAKAVPADLPKPAANAALRAARELGRKGQPLVTALASFADAPAPATNAQDIAALVADIKKSGSPVEGEVIYRRAALACTACHAIGGAGGKVGPDMTTIGASAPLDYLVESLLVPNAKVKEGYHAIALSLKGGRAASGVFLRETPDAIILRDAAGAESSVPKADITARENIGSIMPAGLLNTLTGREKAHVFAFLSQLGKPGPFDATKSNIARVWWLHPGKDEQAVLTGKAPTPGAKTLTYVDGRLPKAALTEALQMVPDSGESVLAVAKFSAGGKTRLNLQGATKAWLDGAPLAIASNPSPEVELPAGDHTLVIKLESKQLPEVLRAECSEGRFATE